MACVDFKPAQPLALRELSQKFQSKYQNPQKKKVSKLSKEFKENAKNLALEFGKKSTIHCMNRILQENAKKFERCFWLLTLVLALLGCIYVCLILSQRFRAGVLQTVVHSTNKAVFEIPFPEVTICNGNHLNWNRIEEAKALFLPHENNTEKLRLFEFVIGLYDNLEFGEFDVFNALKGQPISLVNDVNFSLVFDFMTWRCEEILTDCVWRQSKLNCCDIFSKSRGLNGLCWHFNTLSTEEGRRMKLIDDKYPWRTGSAGMRSGLNLRVLLNTDKHYRKDNDKGLWVSLMEPQVFHKDPYWVPGNTETLIEVEPVIYFYDADTKSLSSSIRQCMFNDERKNYEFKILANFTYMIENCETQCRQEYILSYCNCTMDLLFPQAGYKSCQVKDLLCLAKYNDYFRFIHQQGEEEYVSSRHKGMVCKCFRNCYSLNYITDVRPSFLPSYLRGNKTFIDLDVHFRFEQMMVYRTSFVFGWVDLMVAFGGIAGLFLGCSLISAMELLYFALVELPVFIFNEFKSKPKLRSFENQYNNELSSKQLCRKRCNWGINNRIRAVQNLQKYDLSLYENNLNYKYDAVEQYYLINKQHL